MIRLFPESRHNAWNDSTMHICRLPFDFVRIQPCAGRDGPGRQPSDAGNSAADMFQLRDAGDLRLRALLSDDTRCAEGWQAGRVRVVKPRKHVSYRHMDVASWLHRLRCRWYPPTGARVLRRSAVIWGWARLVAIGYRMSGRSWTGGPEISGVFHPVWLVADPGGVLRGALGPDWR